MQTLAVPDLLDLLAPGRRRAMRYGRHVLFAAVIGGALCAGWQLARPAAADQLADAMAPALQVQLGQEMLRELDAHTLQPSALAAAHQARISDAFAGLQAPHEGAPRHRLLFRGGHAGATAFTLPSGDIILTDDLVRALPDDGAVLAVLAHELGHQQQRHMLRRLVQEAMLPAAASVVLGDAGWLVSSASAYAPQVRWPQQAEIEADNYAADLLQHNGLSLSNLAAVQQAPRAYLAIHPACAERLAQQRERSAL